MIDRECSRAFLYPIRTYEYPTQGKLVRHYCSTSLSSDADAGRKSVASALEFYYLMHVAATTPSDSVYSLINDRVFENFYRRSVRMSRNRFFPYSAVYHISQRCARRQWTRLTTDIAAFLPGKSLLDGFSPSKQVVWNVLVRLKS